MPKETKPKRMMRCLAGLSVHVVGTDMSEHFWPGLEVDFDRELKPGYTVAQAVAGRESCFEPASDEPYAYATAEGEVPEGFRHVDVDPSDPALKRSTIRRVTGTSSQKE